MNAMYFDRIILSGILIVALATSCCKPDSYLYLDEKYKKMQLHAGDTLIYKDQNGFVDTFFVNIATNNFEEKLNYDLCDTKTKLEFIHYGLDTIKNKKNNECSFYTIQIGKTYIDWLGDVFFTGITDAYNFKDSIYIDHRKYYQVYEFIKGNGNKTIKTFFFNYTYGIISYETFDGKRFNIQMKRN